MYILKKQPDDKILLMRRLVEIIHQEKDSFVRIKISSILSEFRKIPKFDIQVSIL